MSKNKKIIKKRIKKENFYLINGLKIIKLLNKKMAKY